VNVIIAAFVADLMFQTRIESVAENLGLKVRWLESADRVLSTGSDGQAGLGWDEILVDQIARIGPKMLIFDLGNKTIPWARWILVLKADSATRGIPVICYGSHVDVDTFKEARQVGSDEVLARSRFVTALPEIIRKYKERIDIDPVEES